MASSARKIFVNLPVKNLDTSMTFFRALGFGFNAQFTDENSASMVISDTIYATLVTHGKFKEFSNKPIADATKQVATRNEVAWREKAMGDTLRGAHRKEKLRRRLLPTTSFHSCRLPATPGKHAPSAIFAPIKLGF